jgi:hypothetical protein
MGSKPAFARACPAASVRSVPRRSGVHPRRWHPVVYLADRGPVRFAARDTMREAFAEARELALALGARTWSVAPGRASVLASDEFARGGAR